MDTKRVMYEKLVKVYKEAYSNVPTQKLYADAQNAWKMVRDDKKNQDKISELRLRICKWKAQVMSMCGAPKKHPSHQNQWNIPPICATKRTLKDI